MQEEGFFSRLSKLGGDIKDRLKAAFSKSSQPYASRSRYRHLPDDNADDDEVVWEGRVPEMEMTTFNTKQAKTSLLHDT